VFRFVPRGGLAVLCGDDALLRGFDPGIGKQTFGFAPDCDARAEFVIADGTDSVSFDIARGESRLRVRLNAYGSHLPSAAAAAALVAANLGLSDGEIRRGLETYRAVEGRANIIKTDTLTIIDDCYNANAASMTAALESLRVQRGRRVAVLGDMFELGEHSGDLHRAAGALAAECCDLLICCGRSAEFYFKGCTAADSGCGKYHFPFADALLERLPELVRPGDTVLVKASHGMNFPVIVDKLKEIG
jgi:UDP-N-acetylmuramoyl-tripeptide--D-alanyl-D-alanine ligase